MSDLTPSSGSTVVELLHELRQPLTTILSNAQAAQRYLSRNPPDVTQLRDILTDIIDHGRSATELVERLNVRLQSRPSAEIGIQDGGDA